MGYILRPLENLGVDGLIMVSGNGALRRCHPIFAAHVSDYQEQVLVTGIKTGECPVCPAHRDDIGDPASVGPPRDPGPILDALDSLSQGATSFTKACQSAGIKPIQHPFWQNLPFVNIYRSITPDILHQLYQGVIKHLISWLRQIYGDVEIDARCRRLPPNHNIHLFMKGISHLSRVTGTEHDQISWFLFSIIIDIPLPNNASNVRLLRAVWGLLDFLNLAKYPVHTKETLDMLNAALKRFHDNKDIFVDLGIRTDFKIPKLHFAGHYRYLIELYGTTDNYNTEYTERLYIDLAKDAYHSTNSKDEFSQMTAWLDRRERILRHDRFLRRRLQADTARALVPQPPPPLVYPRELKMTKHPTVSGVSIASLQEDYGAHFFSAALARFVVHVQHPTFTKAQVEAASLDLHIPFSKVPVFHRIKFVSRDPYSLDPSKDIVVDSIHSEPLREGKYGKPVPGRFDTAVINYNGGGDAGVTGE
jgi:hypothetical protein